MLPKREHANIHLDVKLVGRDKLDGFARKHANSRGPIRAWVAEVEDAHWRSMKNIKNRYPSASILSESKVVFNLGGNNYRLEATVAFRTGIVVVNRIGTHAEYDKWKY